MFKAVISGAKNFKKVIDAASNLLIEICFEVNEERVKAIAMDPDHVALVSIDIPKEAFDEYEADVHSIGVDLEAFKKIMNMAKAKDKLILELDEEKDKLNVVFKGAMTRKFALALYDVSSLDLQVPDIEYPNEILIKAGPFVDALKGANLVSDWATLKVEDGKFIVYAKGDLNESETVFEEDSESIISMNIGEDAKSTFYLEYLRDMTKAASSGDILKIYLGSDMPVKVEYDVAGANLTFLLAPRIES
ncbi:DNA polymerase sliding clamp [Methanotorris igneus]|uniref:DNA polymerase sliding clamp n=1 Tax=Methanotorris igneus (strain DSM 5666 / JCM 11834 / Kol 5) TaxID=880724 RepID=F6BBZ7_METIK|nr:DNA polymerase sliding clamp [Methanotorris igneus]AEF96078.1 DNA polymerase sliding clamp [Methanotorris igneus Kol 5]